ncbi:hypothetical protein [Mesorhizobium sp. 1M-11]|uniref:hypothetical protein n=1 Tax=Mesorhizobium sp. 1M-11 TaxID=1529006 RepID=UPI0006C744E6|nr:hypothetical protein [Mesorhizobium sp. 1M-11]
MKAYFVRKSADCEVVGLFVAPSLVLLAALVDECCDPAICDYAAAPMGGLMVPGPSQTQWPLDEGSSETGFESVTLSQQWDDELRDGGELEWKPLKSAALRMIREWSGTSAPTAGGSPKHAAPLDEAVGSSSQTET